MIILFVCRALLEKKLSSADFRESVRKTNKTERIPGLTESGKYERNYLTVYNLMTHTEDMNVEDLYQYSVVSDLSGVVL